VDAGGQITGSRRATGDCQETQECVGFIMEWPPRLQLKTGQPQDMLLISNSLLEQAATKAPDILNEMFQGIREYRSHLDRIAQLLP
ncbi:MAG: hypothetical protein ABFE13_24355, partial [Phycisphaerales bacterium]